MMQLPSAQEKSVNVIHKRTTEVVNTCVTVDTLSITLMLLYIINVTFPLLLRRCYIYRLLSSQMKMLGKFSSKQSRWIATVWMTKHYNSRYYCKAINLHDGSFLHHSGQPLGGFKNGITHKAKRIPGSVTHVSVVTVRLVRRRFPAAVRRAASRQTGKTQHHHLQ